MHKQYSTGALRPDQVQALIEKMGRVPLVASAQNPDDLPYVWSGKPVTDSASLRSYCSPVEDQLTYGTCTANAVVGIAELYLTIAGRFVPGQDDLSRMFDYWWAGVLDHLQGLDSGRTPRSALVAAAQYGLCRESTEPYTGSEIAQAPSSIANAEGAQHLLGRFSYITPDPDNYLNTIAQIKRALTDGYPITMAFKCYRWVFGIHGPLSTHWDQPGPFSATDPKADYVGNHEVAIVGFQDTNDGTGGYLLIRNSWGTGWGDGGYWAMPYVYIQNAYELWAVQGFDGIGSLPIVNPPLSTAEVSAARARLTDKGLGYESSGAFTFVATGTAIYCATAALLMKEGKDAAQIAQVVSLPADTVRGFLADPINQQYIQAWTQSLA